jgi:hypothetical protein
MTQMPPIDLGRDVIGAIHFRVTIRVRNRFATRWRLRLGAALFVFAGWVTGFKSTTVDYHR